MAARLSPVEFYEREVRPRLHVEDVYQAVAFTAKRGRRWRGPCPLHGGTAPNFSVDTETLGWTCFSGCQKSGSALAFLNGGDPPRGADFVALVRTLASRVGADSSVLDRPPTPEEADRLEREVRRGTLWETFLGLTRAALAGDTGAAARVYLAGRGFTDEEIRDAGFGVYRSPEDVAAGLVGSGFTREEIAAAGLTDTRWRGRLVVPWRDRAGHVGGAVARDLTGSGEPKYLYSAGLSKADLVAFGLDVALRHGRREIVLVEGLLDVALLQSRGVLTVAAIGGAGGEFSPARWEAIAGFGVRAVTLALDNDEAGRSGIRKALDNLYKVPVLLKVSVVDPALLGDAKDPDEYVRAHGVEAFRAVLSQAVPGALHEARTRLGGVGPEAPAQARQQAVEEVLDLLAGLRHETAALDREDILRETAERTGYSEEALSGIAEARILTRQQQDADRRLDVALREAQAARSRGDRPVDVARTLRDTVARVEALTQTPPPLFDVDRLVAVSKETRPGRPSGWPSLDRPEAERGLGLRFHAGELALLAARTGHGKTSVLAGLLRHWLRDTLGDEIVVCYSLEEPEVRMFHRLVALVTHEIGVPWGVNEVRDYLQNPALRETWPHTGTLTRALEALRAVENRLLVVCRPSWSVADLDAHARSVAARRPVAAVLVDYLQRLPGDKAFDRRDLEVSAVARRLKTLAVDLNVPVVAGAQINREAVRGRDVPRDKPYTDEAVQNAIKDRRPKLEHLREGGSEQEADLVLGLLNYRADFEEDADNDRPVPAVTDFEIGVLKNRYGAPGRWVRLAFEGRYHVLTDTDHGR